MNKVRKFIAYVLTIALITTICLPAFASDITNNNNLTQAFYDASPETIVCYMDGYAIRKDQVDQFGVIKPDVVREIQISRFAEGHEPILVYQVLPAGYNNAIVRTSLAAPQYSQINTIYYLTEEHAEQFAADIQFGSLENFFIFITGFIKYVGPVVALTMGVQSLYKSSVASQIVELTNDHKNVKISEASSSFGVFYGVFEWRGRSFQTHTVYDSPTIVETVTNIQYSE